MKKSTSPPRHEHNSPTVSSRAARYSGLLVSGYLIATVATGHGIAAADDSSSTYSSSTGSTADPSGTSSASMPDTADSAAGIAPGIEPAIGAAHSRSVAPIADGATAADTATSTGSTASSVEVAPGVVISSSGGAIHDGSDVESSSTPAADTVPQETPESETSPAEEPVAEPTPGSPSPASASPTVNPSSTSSQPAAPETTSPTAPVRATGSQRSEPADATPVAQATGIAPRVTTVRSSATPTTPSTPFSVAAVPAAPSDVLGVIASTVTGFISTILSPFIAALPADPPAQLPFAWAVLAFVRRNFFNQAPEVTNVTIAPQQSNGVITGDVDAVDPDELGQTVTVRASVYAAPPQPRTPACDCGEVDGSFFVGGFTNAAVLGTAPGDTWHAPDAVDNTCVYVGPDGAVTYSGTETGDVTIDGLGSGYVSLTFEGLLTSATSERSVAQLQPNLGTGALKGVTGTVISESTLNADGSATGVLTGQVVRPELRYVVVRQAEHGTVALDEITGQFTYTPDPAFAAQGGVDSFDVVVTDGRFNLLGLLQRYNGDPVKTINLNVVSTSAA